MKKRELGDGGGNEVHERRHFKAEKENTTTRREEVFFFIFCSSIIDINTYRQETETKLLNSYYETDGVMDSVVHHSCDASK